MPILEKPRHEQMAQLVAKGSSISQAFIDVGFKQKSLAWRVGATPEFKARVAEIQKDLYERTSLAIVHGRKWILGEVALTYDRCTQAVPVIVKGDHKGEECELCGNWVGMYEFDAKNALQALHMLGLEEGMFKRHLDVTSRKVPMIEGNQKEILDKFAQLLKTLGIGAISQLLNEVGHDNLVAAMELLGYEVAKANGKDVGRHELASGGVGDAAESGEPDAEPLQPAPEAAPVS